MKWFKWLIIIGLFVLTGLLAFNELQNSLSNINQVNYKTGLIYYAFFFASALLLFFVASTVLSFNKELKQSGSAFVVSIFIPPIFNLFIFTNPQVRSVRFTR